MEQSAYSDAEMEHYDKCGDAVRVEQAYIDEVRGAKILIFLDKRTKET